MKVAELNHAYWWLCPECEQENFERCMVVDQSEEAMDEVLEQENIEKDEDAVHIMIKFPEKVKCKHCGKTFFAEEGTNS